MYVSGSATAHHVSSLAPQAVQKHQPRQSLLPSATCQCSSDVAAHSMLPNWRAAHCTLNNLAVDRLQQGLAAAPMSSSSGKTESLRVAPRALRACAARAPCAEPAAWDLGGCVRSALAPCGMSFGGFLNDQCMMLFLPCVFLSKRFGSLASAVHILCRAWARSCLPELVHLFVQEGALSCGGGADVTPRDALQLTTAAGRSSHR
jgi:hypothetical protein